MPTIDVHRNKDDAHIEALFHQEYRGLVRYAQTILRRYAPKTIDIDGRAEEIVQEVFITAGQKKEDWMGRENPRGWLLSTVVNKTKEALREDRKFVNIMRMLPSDEMLNVIQEPDELPNLLSAGDYALLKMLYLDGYSYKELCEAFGVKKSTLGMQVNRIKKEFKKKYKDYF